MPVAVANSAQVISAATRHRARHPARGDVQRREQPVDDVGALDDVAHEQEQRHRGQHVVRHDRIGLVDEQVEDAVVEEPVDPGVQVPVRAVSPAGRSAPHPAGSK